MTNARQLGRLRALSLLMAAAFVGLGYRLVDLQVLQHEKLAEEAKQNTVREFLLEPKRGEIRDIRGNLLATSLAAKTVCADPSLIGRYQPEVAHAIAPLLQMPENKLVELLSRTWRTNAENKVVTNRYVVLHRKVPLENWRLIQTNMLKLQFGIDEKKLKKVEARFYTELRQSAVFADPVDDSIRIYPQKRLASHVLGYTGMHKTEVNGRDLLETVGMDGIEATLNARLSGVRGWRVTERDKRNHELVANRMEDVEPADGLNVVLTLDAGVQYIVETELAQAVKEHSPISAMCLAVRPRTGQIVAWCVLPNFDPNTPGEFSPDALRNRPLTDITEPGSTFKIVVVSGALNDHTIKLSDMFDCENGAFHFAGKTLHDHAHYGLLSAERIITKSSNIGAAKIGIKLGQNRLYDYIRGFGFGERTRIALPGEVNGLVHPTKAWSQVSIAQIPMGHGIAVTPLQMTMAICALANEGRLMRPMLVDRLEDNEGAVTARFEPEMVRQVVKPEAATEMIKALKTVTTKEGTAAKARLDHYTVAGKTGTAQKAENGAYSHDKYFSSFIGFFPADKPELCIAVMLDCPKSGHYGGDVCAPVFKRIADKTANYLNIRPDIETEEKGEKLAGRAPGALAAAHD